MEKMGNHKKVQVHNVFVGDQMGKYLTIIDCEFLKNLKNSVEFVLNAIISIFFVLVISYTLEKTIVAVTWSQKLFHRPERKHGQRLSGLVGC